MNVAMDQNHTKAKKITLSNKSQMQEFILENFNIFFSAIDTIKLQIRHIAIKLMCPYFYENLENKLAEFAPNFEGQHQNSQN